MKNPVSTYRIQLNPEFTFKDLKGILDYLGELGVSTIYSAPFFQARKGSSHGYDITDPFEINREIGTLQEFKEIAEILKQKKMNWLQDIVPNHMAFDGTNIFLNDIFELGPHSLYFNFFDIDWAAKDQKVMAPFLGEPLEEVLQKRDLQLVFSEDRLMIKYFDHKYPASFNTYAEVFSDTEVKSELKNFRGNSEKWKQLKNDLFDTLAEEEVNNKLEEINASEERLKKVLELQFFLPEHWKKTEEEINYRRFFTINDLICLSMEDKSVFEQYHKFIFELCQQKLIRGLRIDHIDGLFDPKGYLENLRSVLGPEFYIIIEKILEWDEKLPSHWPVQGTSGYSFLAEVNQVLTQHESEALFTREYHKINPRNDEYAELVYKQKLFILKKRMGGEYNNLWNLAHDLDLINKDSKKCREALGAFLAAFPVYRIYPEDYPLKKRQKEIIDTAFQSAVKHFPELEQELDHYRDLFLGEAKKKRENMLFFLQRCQQFTGPLAAKGVEDTSFYIFNKLISHNEVGDSPENFGISVSDFHQRMKKRQEDFPLSVNATATHDTKRGEDARMRINVLSELGKEWFQKVKIWQQILSEERKDGTIPDVNEEYFIYQMLVGHWPFNKPKEDFLERCKAYLQKVLREAKEHSSWADPDEEYENKVYDFLETLLKNEKFLESFLPFQKKVAAFGAAKSLSQCMMKVTAPGIPDVYQGTELWDLNFVDPDNRRPVDYKIRLQYLKEIKAFENNDLKSHVKELKIDFTSGKINFFTLHSCLMLRKASREIFEEGEYLPIELDNGLNDKIVGYARKKAGQYVLIFAPVMVTEVFDEQLELLSQICKKKLFVLPEEFPNNWKNHFTGETFSERGDFLVEDLLSNFPVAIITNID